MQLGLLRFRLLVCAVDFPLYIRRGSARAGAEVHKGVFLEVGGAEDGLQSVGDEGRGGGGLEEGGLEFPDFG